jgi:MoaA/NifB/PqqE/SkfB family radical SAM enzyme
MNATSEGIDMSLKTFRRIIEYYQPESIDLGGGEPTIHPKFWQFLMLAIINCENVWLATNGSKTKIALALAKLAQKGVINCDLSQDDYHAPIDEKVVKAFTRKSYDPLYSIYKEERDCRGIRNTTKNKLPYNSGRCDFGEDGCCCCGEPVIYPDGSVKQCGCYDSPIVGNVFDDEVNSLDNNEWECHKNLKKSS